MLAVQAKLEIEREGVLAKLQLAQVEHRLLQAKTDLFDF